MRRHGPALLLVTLKRIPTDVITALAPHNSYLERVLVTLVTAIDSLMGQEISLNLPSNCSGAYCPRGMGG